MTEHYTYHLGGGGFSNNSTLDLNYENCSFVLTYDEYNMSAKNNVEIKGVILNKKNNYCILNSTELILNNKSYKANGISFEFIKLNETIEVSEYNNEWRDIEMGNRVKFNVNFEYNAILLIQYVMFDHNFVSSEFQELNKLLHWFNNLKFVGIINDDSDDDS